MGQSTPIRKRVDAAAADASHLAEQRFQTELARWYSVGRLPDPNTPRETWDGMLAELEARLAVKH